MKILDFARQAGFSNQIAHYYFRKEAIKRSTLLEFCTMLGISLDEFYAWTHPRRALPLPAQDLHHGRRLDEMIEEKGLNKTRLAGRMALSRRALYNLLEKPVFTPEQLKKVCQVLEISQKEFIGGGVEDGGAELVETETWKDKYYRLLEDYNLALLEIARLRESLAASS